MSFTEFISDVNNFDASNITFSAPKEGRQGCKRIYLNIRDGNRKGPIYIETGSRFCFGVQASTDMQNKEKINGYQMAIPMWDTEEATEEQLKFLNVFDQIASTCIKHLIQPETKKATKKFSLTEAQLVDKFTPMWYKRTIEGEPDKSKGPTLYAKLLTEGQDDLTITTQFQDTDGYTIEPMTLLNNMFKIEKCLLHIHSIFIGTTVKLQVKVVEVEVEKRQKRKAPLMLRKRPVVIQEEEEEEEEPEDEKTCDQEEPEDVEVADVNNQEAEMPQFDEPEPEPVPEPAAAAAAKPASKRTRRQL